MDKIIVTGCGTDVGKTVVSAILAIALQADYWKPIECEAKQSDSEQMKKWLSPSYTVHPPSYSFQASLSPHHAARLEKKEISLEKIVMPQTKRPLVMETAGGILVPLNSTKLSLDLFKEWQAVWIVVSRHYLGSINHTLLTLEILKALEIRPFIIFNGDPQPDSEDAIQHFSKTPCLGRLLPESKLSFQTLEKYAHSWKKNLINIL